jgi:hypothetical protein
MDRITFQNQIWQFNEMSSLIKTFYNHYLFHKKFPHRQEKTTMSSAGEEIRFTKVLTKYSTEYNNILFIYHLCQELDMDKKDLFAFFQELRLFYDQQKWTEKLPEIEKIFENTTIDKLDIKRIYRYLDKNVKNETSVIYDDVDDPDDEII